MSLLLRSSIQRRSFALLTHGYRGKSGSFSNSGSSLPGCLLFVPSMVAWEHRLAPAVHLPMAATLFYFRMLVTLFCLNCRRAIADCHIGAASELCRDDAAAADRSGR